jgi:hypothetical protein
MEQVSWNIFKEIYHSAPQSKISYHSFVELKILKDIYEFSLDIPHYVSGISNKQNIKKVNQQHTT